ncbi:AraC family transcriptional regulator [Flavobacterium sp.]|uniref:helix-turn-helix domain-containing protein n=1 Tax=Flavobacterium sp. TaxID=239 RepID=UPI00120763B3|nr:AraC family transcriptional regulator [Flavobacterium sp.]RZJ71464.1 MAG: AraC family transcriptional regulator [Flavobacterium sp.]
MQNPNEIIPGVIFYSYLSTVRKDKVGFLGHNTLVMQVAGHFTLETANEKITMTSGELLLIRKNQLGTITKTPLPGQDYQTFVLILQDNVLRKIAHEEKIDSTQKYHGPPNLLIPNDDFIKAFFQSIVPYINASDKITAEMGEGKVREAVRLLLRSNPRLATFLFDFSEPHKIDLEKFMLSNYHFNMSVEKFAQLTGRSLAAFKRDFKTIFGTSPRQWLQETRLNQARQLIERKKAKPSTFYLDLGFETLSHFSHSFKKKFGIAPSELLV